MILTLQKILICAKYLRPVECDNLVVNTTILIHLVLLDRFGSVCTAFWKWFIRFARVSTPMHKPILMGKVNNLLKSLYPYLINKCSSMNDNFMGRQKWTTFSYISTVFCKSLIKASVFGYICRILLNFLEIGSFRWWWFSNRFQKMESD